MQILSCITKISVNKIKVTFLLNFGQYLFVKKRKPFQIYNNMVSFVKNRILIHVFKKLPFFIVFLPVYNSYKPLCNNGNWRTSFHQLLIESQYSTKKMAMLYHLKIVFIYATLLMWGNMTLHVPEQTFRLRKTVRGPCRSFLAF